MNTQELYDYIDERLESLSTEEKQCLKAFNFEGVAKCIHTKSELLDMKLFIQSKA